VIVDGKQFSLGRERFHFRGVTYGTFAPRADGHQFPERERMKRDFAAISEAEFTVVRTYTAPPDDLVELASDWGLRVVAGLFTPDWRYSFGCSRRGWARTQREMSRLIREHARRLAGCEAVLAISIGNEIPADVVRWNGTRRVERAIAALVDTVRSEDDHQLVTYGNFPTTEYLALPTLDFAMFNVYLDDPANLRRYLTRLHHVVGDRPLVLGEIGVHTSADREGEQEQAERLAVQLDVALERGVAGTCVFSWTDDWWVGGAPVEGWRFGLTTRHRRPRPALGTARRANRRTVADVDFDWPSISVVICAYNAADTIDECLAHACALDYPDLEVVVVDDGSCDDTRAIVAEHPRARCITIPHGGLSVARNEGLRAARGELVAFLDSDAYPIREWPYFLALALDRSTVAGAGGPNFPPPSDGVGAQQVARAPGGPVHVLLGDDRAEHVPGCNMAFWKDALIEVGGFDPIFTAAGDDVDVCWKLLDRGWEIGFHPAALVWHHRRAGLRRYLHQQRGYGRSETLVESRHPGRYNMVGGARWRGRVYAPSARAVPGRVYRGPYGTAAFQSVYRADAHGLDLLHQGGVPVAAVVAATAPLGLVVPVLALPALLAFVFVATLFFVDATRVHPPRDLRTGRARFRLGVALMHVLQPLVRRWGRWRSGARPHESARRMDGAGARSTPRGGVALPSDDPREVVVDRIAAALRRAGVRVVPSSGWEPYDARLVGSALVLGELVTSAFPEGLVQVRVRRRPRWANALAVVAAGVVVALAGTPELLVVVCLAALDVARGFWRTGHVVRRALRGDGGR
jgi:GT2 family glycosyltransferase